MGFVSLEKNHSRLSWQQSPKRSGGAAKRNLRDGPAQAGPTKAGSLAAKRMNIRWRVLKTSNIPVFIAQNQSRELC